MRWNERIGAQVRVRDLHILRVVAESGTMLRAAETLNLSQSAVSKIVSELETLFGVELFERSPRGVSLTEAGRLVVERGRVVFDEMAQTVEEAKALSSEGGEIRLGTTEPLTNILAEIIERMAALQPKITYVVDIADPDTLLARIRERALDVVVTRWVEKTGPDDLAAQMLMQSPFAVMAAKEHAYASRGQIALAELSDQAWCLSPPGTLLHRIVANLFHEKGLSVPSAAVTTSSIYMRLTLMSGGRYLSILPTTMLRHVTNRDWLVPLAVDLSSINSPIAAVSLKARRQSNAMRTFFDAARQIGSDIA